ncbi:MAG: hypothetical protein UR85_C0008G0006 [Candidatus Nomurabacteria bacterium GW2011_GWF2_35_66]|uniref:Uncharacterized protein n=1 Tax=Candidatus Nomurabacteria bacterium GW2011_GWE1_35_16 TaxID=1618761 RepID=A0A0G0BRH3_9BACT|nr:MAG: hypothetical protein UR55_C0011G0006 [Candidatus Nomurabacteria bacterium GW2011_GWF1_34_20]KKP62842.1 MAG: hypothetical protein UR57_C0010G0006 [Candidatus Nomurabacteria bacterium GW2011_GWE2_34_25]KKP66241.1 MAG: hypothetical protein UR64_C0010G0006 [Candidatus Nomurabacteria bacterium GW2011_GWE1_35_16]KKP83073.1 MAG: hypothetical protein UR85_C0008G0006 [Candidatus Nomurabacteria bacterium GW2011_GWF2_35_66]HAE36668.1 hypothetical protein [Candidatus Nomurabacteria bacterium]
MRKERTLFIVGIWVTVLPYFGFPEIWRKVLFIVTGFALIYLAYLFYIETKARLNKEENRIKSFVDNISDGGASH